ncbi:MAG: hypothetical protein JST01_06800 [Cyanobacteria bacterium SZAS TMP-1]|nr:hypothetical protein [Cyanobacteria bacterium SZAS TMP-1]
MKYFAKILRSCLHLVAALSVGPPLFDPPNSYAAKISNWHIECPTTVYGVDNFGFRKGRFVLHFLDNGRHYAIPIDIEDLDCYDRHVSVFGRWKAEKFLTNIAVSEGKADLWLTFTANSCHMIQVENIEVLSGTSKTVPPPFVDEWGWDHLRNCWSYDFDNEQVYLDKQTLPVLWACSGPLLPLLLFMFALWENRPEKIVRAASTTSRCDVRSRGKSWL